MPLAILPKWSMRVFLDPFPCLLISSLLISYLSYLFDLWFFTEAFSCLKPYLYWWQPICTPLDSHSADRRGYNFDILYSSKGPIMMSTVLDSPLPDRRFRSAECKVIWCGNVSNTVELHCCINGPVQDWGISSRYHSLSLSHWYDNFLKILFNNPQIIYPWYQAEGCLLWAHSQICMMTLHTDQCSVGWCCNWNWISTDIALLSDRQTRLQFSLL